MKDLCSRKRSLTPRDDNATMTTTATATERSGKFAFGNQFAGMNSIARNCNVTLHGSEMEDETIAHRLNIQRPRSCSFKYLRSLVIYNSVEIRTKTESSSDDSVTRAKLSGIGGARAADCCAGRATLESARRANPSFTIKQTAHGIIYNVPPVLPARYQAIIPVQVSA